MSKILDLVSSYIRIGFWLFVNISRKTKISSYLLKKEEIMKKIGIIILLNVFLSANVFAGCMKNEIKQIDAKLNSENISVEKKAKIKALIEIVVANEHDNSELAFESYEKAMSLVN